jgi:hypothetical protein
MSSPFVSLYGRIKTVLDADGTLRASVPQANIRPSGSPATREAGPMVVYGWRGDGVWDVNRRRGSGRLALFVESPNSKSEAHELLDLVRNDLTPTGLTSGTLRVAKCQEKPSMDEAVPEEAGLFRVQADFELLFAVGNGAA